MNRLVEPELLDSLPASDPRAVKSRGDLRRLNALMDHTGILVDLLSSTLKNRGRIRIAELGAGDGTFALNLARRLGRSSVKADLVLVDQQNIVASRTLSELAAIGWNAEVAQADVFQWLASAPPVDWILANLFLHHFSADRLRELLNLAASKTVVFLACEPRRGRFALNAASILGLIGCNAITRHDAVVSVRAGFAGRDLSELWPSETGWQLKEDPAGLFSHSFMAQQVFDSKIATSNASRTPSVSPTSKSERAVQRGTLLPLFHCKWRRGPGRGGVSNATAEAYSSDLYPIGI